MNENTKKGLKKFGKVTAFGLGLFAMFLLGYGLRGCPTQKGSSNSVGVEDHFSRCGSPNRLQALPSPLLLNESEHNMLSVSHASSMALGFSLNTATVSFSSSLFTFVVPVSAFSVGQSYVFDFDGDSSDVASCAVSQLVTDKLLANEPDTISGNNVRTSVFYSNVPFTFDFTEVYSDFASVVFRCPIDGSNFGLYVEDDYYLSVVSTLTYIDMGEFYNPLPMVGQTINDASVIVYNGEIPESGYVNVDFVSTSSNRFSFVSSGRVFDGFRIELTRVMNVEGSSVERYATRNGETMIAPDMSLNYVTADAFYYRLLGSQQWIKVWELPYNGSDDGYNYWSYNGRWLSNSFRYVSVKVDGGATGSSQWLPTFTLSELLALNVWTAGAYVLGDAYNNVFTMLGKGFESVGGILSIQILPYMTLGTLIFVPLVVLIIFAILRILNK